MATLTLRVDDAVRDELERAARARGTTISDLLRSAIDDLLGWETAGTKEWEDHIAVPQTLDAVQRLTFALLHEILGKLPDDEDGTDYHRRQAEVMKQGFAGEYSTSFGFMAAELTPAECTRLHDILGMFQTLEVSLARLAAVDREGLGTDAQYVLIFDGFDLRRPEEARLLTYARYLVKDEGLWSQFRERLTTGERGNSHSPRLARYLRMLPVYVDIRDRHRSGRGRGLDDHLFQVNDLLSMIEAARHPDRA